MARKPKTNRVPRTRAGGEWTEAAYWGFIRSALRSASRRYPPIVRLALHAVRRPYKGENKRQKWEYQCENCGKWFKGTKVQVDHVVPCGSLKSVDDVGPFVARLFCEPNGLIVLCKDKCHAEKTARERGAK